MLRQLTVSNYALVDALDVSFSDGLTVITGESGAGKSILLGALALVLGHRAHAGHVRPDSAKADICAEFEVGRMPATTEFLTGHDLLDEDAPERCLLRRTVTKEGRSRAFVNGAPVTLHTLRSLTEALVDIHGQNEHQRLGEAEVQLGLLDDFADLRAAADEVRDAHRAWQRLANEHARLAADVAAKEDRAALLSYQVNELADAHLTEDEFPQLVAEHKRLSHAEVIQGQVSQTLEYAADTPLHGMARALEQVDDNQPHLAAARDLLNTSLTHLDEAATELRAYQDAFDADPGRLNDLDQRLTVLHDLARKHHVPPEQLHSHSAALEGELATLSTDRDALGRLEQAIDAHQATFRKQAEKLGRARRKGAKAFAARVTECLRELGIKDGALTLEFEAHENERGLERVRYLVTTNPKYPPGTLKDIASGGEQARISLAIQVVAAEKTALPCLVLDEADVGVGGTTADVIGRVLRSLAEHTQVLCVSHAPQVAALAETHLLVTKSAQQDTDIEHLDAAARVEELARMLAGSDITDKSRAYAETLLAEAGG